MFSKHCKVTIISQCLVVVCIENNVSNLFSGVSKQCLTLIFFQLTPLILKNREKNVEKGERRSQIFESPMISGKRENDQHGF